jgi:hypothetical protein
MRIRLSLTLFALGTLVTALLAGCADNSLPTQLDKAEASWQAASIDSYIIEVSFTRAIWHHQTHVITVRAGAVVESTASCVTAPMETALGEACIVEAFDPETYTVPGLFARARSLAAANPEVGVEIDFHDTYQFPSRIWYDLPDAIDDEQALVVRSFTVTD